MNESFRLTFGRAKAVGRANTAVAADGTIFRDEGGNWDALLAPANSSDAASRAIGDETDAAALGHRPAAVDTGSPGTSLHKRNDYLLES